MRYGMVIDLKTCIGCYGCQTFCKSENASPAGVLLSRVMFYESGRYPDVKKVPLPVLCMQCESPACVGVCPTGASEKRPDGIVTIDAAKCTGCLNCVTACSWGARHLYPENVNLFPGQGITPYETMARQKYRVGVVGKCNFCLSRIEKGLEPACVANCMTKARHFGDLDDPNSEISQLINNRRTFHIYPAIFPGKAGTKPENDCSVFYLER